MAFLSYLPGKEKEVYCRELFDKVSDGPFESTTIPIPQGYDEYLTQVYGDYMTPARCGSVHSGIIWDTKTPYTEYYKEK